MSDPKQVSRQELEKVVGGANYIGTEQPDWVGEGTPGADYVEGRGGDDGIHTGEGNDAIVAGEGNDYVDAGAGDDWVDGGAGNDALIGGEGNDALVGGEGSDMIAGGAGVDYTDGGEGNDVLYNADTDGAADAAFGGGGDDIFAWRPGSGSDYFEGGEGRDAVDVWGVSPQQLGEGLQVFTPGLQMQTSEDGIRFVDAQGQPQTFSGQLTIGGETLRFDNVETIRMFG